VYHREVDVFENRRALPRAYFVGAARAVDGPESASEALQDPTLDPYTTAVVEGPLPPEVPPIPPVGSPAGQARILAYDAQEVSIAVRADTAGVLVLSDTYYSGWQAEVDGASAPVLPTDLALRGVVLGPGEHTVIFLYLPWTFTLGLALAVLALIALAATTALLGALARARSGDYRSPSA
jgi:hypothetical protein